MQEDHISKEDMNMKHVTN